MSLIKKRLVTYKQLRDYGIPWSRAHLDRLERQTPPQFPLRIPLGQCRVVWDLQEIEEHIADRAARRKQPLPRSD